MEAEQLDTLRAVQEACDVREMMGATAHVVADLRGWDVAQVMLDLERLDRDGFLDHDTGPTGSLWYGLTDEGEAAIRDSVRHGGDAPL